VSAFGTAGPGTPALDSLAAGGYVFANVHATAPTTLASTSSLMTSLHPRMHGAVRNDHSLDPSMLTLAEVLAGRGYTTAGFAGSFSLHSNSGIAQGFSLYDEDFTGQHGSFEPQRRASEVTDAVAAWLESGPPKEPFFLFVHYWDPHVPYAPPPPFDRPGAGALTGITGSMADVGMLKAHLREGGEVDERCTRMHELYKGEVAYTDREIGRLVGLLERTGTLGHSLLVFTSDHGETFWEHREMREHFDHGYMVYETTTRVPLFFRWPGRVPAGESALPASTIDTAPTILDLLGFEIPGEFGGRSLAPAIRGGALEEAPVFTEATNPFGTIERGAIFKNDFKPKCIFLGNLKLIWMPFLADREEVYDLASDPGEARNLLESETIPESVESMRGMLRQWAKKSSGIARNSRSRTDPETVMRLRALGYVVEEDPGE
jgi:arylsulfatase A-like enzyme